MCETFWGVYFDSFNEAFYEPWNAYSCGDGDNKRSYYTIYIDDIFYGEIKLFWDENGVRSFNAQGKLDRRRHSGCPGLWKEYYSNDLGVV